MKPEFAGIERRLERLDDCIAKLDALRIQSRDDFSVDGLLRDIAERNLEVAAQCCIDLANRIISLEGAMKSRDNFDALVRMGELGVLDPIFARHFAPLAGFRNILVHEYLDIDWDDVYDNLQRTGDLLTFSNAVKDWLSASVRQ